MRKIILLMLLFGFMGLVGVQKSNAQIVDQVKKAGGVTKRTTEKAGKKVASVSKSAANETAEKTKIAGHKGWHGAKWVGKKTKSVLVGDRKAKPAAKPRKKAPKKH